MTAAELAGGLRELADWLDDHPEMPVPLHYLALDVALSAEEATLAGALLGDQPPERRGGHLVVERSFGAVRLRCFHVPDSEVAAYQERLAIADEVLAARAANTIDGPAL